MRTAAIITSGLILMIITVSYLLILDHANTYVDSEVPPCSLAQFDPNCSPSGWMGFLLGDLIVAIALGFFLHYMSVRNAMAMAETTSDIKKILEMTKKVEERRAIFVKQAMKNHFSALLIAMGLMNRLLLEAKSHDDIQSTLRTQHATMTRTIQRAYSTLAMYADLMDPLLIDEATNLLYKLELVKVDSELGNGFPDYEETKDAIAHYTSKLDEAIDHDAVLK